jgi:ABC-2 type transport system ATP-binding protein
MSRLFPTFATSFNQQSMSIKVEHITKLYGTQKALDNVSLDIKPGEVVGLLGPNGAGKSTLMKILACYIPPSSGDASVCGFDVLEHSMEVRKRVGYLPENNPLYLDLYVKEFLGFMAGIDHTSEVRGQRSEISSTQHPASSIRNRVQEIIELTGLQDEQHKKIGALSRGYRQRVGLAQALLHDPEVLILDEPTSGLDPNQLVEIRALIKEIGKKKTVMLSTHIMQEVEAICDRTIIIHKGRIVADDLTRNLQQMSDSKVLIKVEFDRPVLRDNLTGIPGINSVTAPSNVSDQVFPKDKKSGTIEVKKGSGIQHPCLAGRQAASSIWHLTSDPSIDIRPTVFKFAVDNGLTVLSLQREEQRLEEVFKELTKT